MSTEEVKIEASTWQRSRKESFGDFFEYTKRPTPSVLYILSAGSKTFVLEINHSS